MEAQPKSGKVILISLAIIVLVVATIVVHHASQPKQSTTQPTASISLPEATTAISQCQADGYDQHADGSIVLHFTDNTTKVVTGGTIQALDAAGQASQTSCHRSFQRDLE